MDRARQFEYVREKKEQLHEEINEKRDIIMRNENSLIARVINRDNENQFSRNDAR